MPPKIVLYEPLIPQNTGNIGRLTAANYLELHLIEPLGFKINDRNLKRAGLDYWNEVSLTIHSHWISFLESVNPPGEKIFILSKKASVGLYETSFPEDSVLVFGNETEGLPDHMHEKYSKQRIKIPMRNPNIRSLNLANSVAIVCYEVLRQNRNY
ncbi:MAG TPA: tRNA (cytidine(34)-2'-O)-methyltransferase [Oligoflexia bacterium]|nr:tRNA (cytidine(34)-2'-O)-methyltransferase [Oligoflexia bacterium]HMP47919.1 tRNA (cytidine(34)-2'-O)-methyltransferase [Oligoflexia bacterium]